MPFLLIKMAIRFFIESSWNECGMAKLFIKQVGLNDSRCKTLSMKVSFTEPSFFNCSARN